MSSQKLLLVALPASITRDQSVGSAFEHLRDVVTPDASTTIHQFPIPEFKIGTLDALVQQADDLSKLDSTVENAVHKAADVISTLVPGEEARYKLVNNRPSPPQTATHAPPPPNPAHRTCRILPYLLPLEQVKIQHRAIPRRPHLRHLLRGGIAGRGHQDLPRHLPGAQSLPHRAPSQNPREPIHALARAAAVKERPR